MSNTSDQVDLLKLSREQLKKLCKERGHTGYSKCTKPQLVALLGSGTPSKFNPSMMTAMRPPEQDAPSSFSLPKKRLEPDSSGLGEPIAKKQKYPSRIPSKTGLSVKSPTPSAPSQAKQKSRPAQQPQILRESLVPPMSTTPATVPHHEGQPILPTTSYLLPQPPEPTNSSPRPSGSNVPLYSSKKFTDPRKITPNSCLIPRGPQSTSRSTTVAPPSTISVDPLPTPYLGFSELLVSALGPINMPPSIYDRKRVSSWSIILSGISNAERRTCILVSRMFRYAVYLSASVILFSKFPGKRLQDVAHVFSPSMFNFWPYLRARERELAEQRSRYLSSYLCRFYKTFEPIDRSLWTSPDNPKQYAVAIRFIMSRFWFATSKCPSPLNATVWLRSVVFGARELVPNEIWELKTTTTQGSTTAKTETFYVLEPTCEVIGRPAAITVSPSETLPDDQHRFPIRVDWSEYVNDHILSFAEVPGKRLLDRVQWAHYEEYQHGISRHFLTRTQSEGEVGELKRQVAERYILASVVENSVSGPWRSVQEMARESFLLVGLDYANKRSKMTMKMFLSAHHHVESVHFQSSHKRPFHPAVATVQTTAREYYILKDNGMLIGTEEDGVHPLWQTLLKCDEKGLPCDSSAPLSTAY